MPGGTGGLENAPTGKSKAAMNNQKGISGGGTDFLSGDIKKANMFDQIFVRVDLKAFFYIFYFDPLIMPVPAIEGGHRIAVAVR